MQRHSLQRPGSSESRDNLYVGSPMAIEMRDKNRLAKIFPLLALALSTSLVITPLTGADQPRFEVASVKHADRCSGEHSMDPGMISLNGYPLKVVLQEAFNVKMDQITGPSWLDGDCFAIVAKMPEGATRDQLPAMFQALLSERLKLAAHKESRQSPGYALTVDKGGPKFKETDLGSPDAIAHAGQVTFGASTASSRIKGSITMALLARFVSQRLNAPVQDLTGLQGKYDVDVSWVPDRTVEKARSFALDGATDSDTAVAEASLPAGKEDIFTSFRDTLGLRLEPRKEQVEVLVIDHIERIPTGN